ncbi:MAG TPA: HAD family hydrolase [Gammaproteobacteria bacterium]|jgi:phosphoglycolate phosphatase-like HAD superfamily hydrolase|nr:HAD family hydrolase [Gammaproteobacteria bacterium]
MLKKRMIIYMIILFSITLKAFADDALPSWNNTALKKQIIDFVNLVTNRQSASYVAPENRIATFDNDGTLWVEQPIYPQYIFALQQLKKIAPEHPEWKNDPTFQKVFQNKMTELSKQDIEKILIATHTGMSVQSFENSAKNFLQNARDPKFQHRYTELVYQPMLEMIRYLQKNQFSVYIVSGGGQDFIRSFADKTYGIPRNYIVGTAGKMKYIYQNDQPVLIKLPEMLLDNNNDGKVKGIELVIGIKPLIAFGNSDGDREMLEWTGSGTGKRMMLLVHHDDAEREYAYDKNSKVGTFSETLFAEAKQKHWNIISMKNDWKVIFPFSTVSHTGRNPS